MVANVLFWRRLQPYCGVLFRHRSLTLAVMVSAASAVNAATDQTNSLLIEQGLFWQEQENLRRAGEGKSSADDATHPDALRCGLGLIAVQDKNQVLKR